MSGFTTQDWGPNKSWELAWDDYAFEYNYFPAIPDPEQYKRIREHFKKSYLDDDKDVVDEMERFVEDIKKEDKT